MVNENAVPIMCTNQQFDGITRLCDIFIYGVKQLVFETTLKSLEADDFFKQLINTPNHIIVNFRFIHRSTTYILVALVALDGTLTLLDGTTPECVIDYIYVID